MCDSMGRIDWAQWKHLIHDVPYKVVLMVLSERDEMMSDEKTGGKREVVPVSKTPATIRTIYDINRVDV